MNVTVSITIANAFQNRFSQIQIDMHWARLRRKQTKTKNRVRTLEIEDWEASTMRQEQKPGLLSDWESADSAGLRTFSSPLIEFASNEYIAGRSEAESAMDVRTNLSSDRWKIFVAKLEKKRFFGLCVFKNFEY